MAVEDRYATAPFREAIEYLRSKINLDTDSWRDIADDENDAFFVVAGAKGSLLSELRAAVDKAIERGQRPDEFQAAFEQIAKGWEYRGDAGWRSQIIFRTNLRASYGRGRDAYQQDPEVQRLQPFLQYVHGDSLNPRPSHLALDGKVFRANAIPFPLPAGYGCSCRYISLSQRELERAGLSVSEIQKGDSVAVEMPDGQVQQAVIEPDPGWDRTPGLPSEARRQALIQRVIDRSPPEIAAQIRAEVEAYEANRPLSPNLLPKSPSPQQEELIAELANRAVAFTEAEVVWIGRNREEQIIWLETGTPDRGLRHILRKQEAFTEAGVAAEDIADLVIAAVERGVFLANQGTRPIYQVEFQGRNWRVAVQASDNGFIVGANPVGERTLRKALRRAQNS